MSALQEKPVANAYFFSPETLMHDGQIPPASQVQAPPPPQPQAVPANGGAQASVSQQGSANVSDPSLFFCLIFIDK
ncbi:uncharacterized protein ARMOST_18894 [Armillaria ostoyae]|uniref:Uncharacterized protein n=1 Tax=Armillaria ostoyae TaxID=47428 RepID=A0A284S356_ARMOS|nr:uncharacterized protein ARMOST_18894 [Armillaria ostoyae]